MTEKKSSKASWYKLVSYLKNYKGLVIGNILSNLLTSIFSLLAIPLLIPLVELIFLRKEDKIDFPEKIDGFQDFEQYLNAFFLQYSNDYGHQRAVLYVCLFFLATFFLANLFRYLSLYFMAPVRQGIVKDLRNSVFEKLLYLPLSFYGEERKGDLISRLTSDVQEVEWSILNVLEAVFRNPIMIIGVLAYMIWASPALTLFVFVLLLVAVLILTTISRTLRKKSGKAQKILGYMISLIEEGLGGLRIIKSFSAEKYQLNKFKKVNREYYDVHINILRRRDLASPFSEFFGISIALILLYYGSSQVLKGSINPGAFMAYLFAFFRLIDPAKALSNAFFNIQKGKAALDRLDEVLNKSTDIIESSNPVSISGIEKGIVLDDVSFSYNDSKEQVLRNINLDIPRGQTIALVGESGSGKSTLVDLIPRFYEIKEGSIEIDGQNIKNYSLSDLRSLFGIVSQEPILFNDSILNNITFGETADMAKVEEVAKMAHAHDFICNTAEGYKTVIGDRGMKLSGGQRQRITIARALYKNPDVLIFDEATSALDTESEKLVQQALAAVTKDRTSIIIAHRLSTIQHADWIIVLDKGRIVEQGTHDQLMELDNQYAQLVKMQQL